MGLFGFLKGNSKTSATPKGVENIASGGTDLFASLTQAEKNACAELDPQILLFAKQKVDIVGLPPSVGLLVSKLTEPQLTLLVELQTLMNDGEERARQGDHKSALERYLQVVAKAPWHCIAQKSAGACCHHLGETETSLTFFEQAGRLAPADVSILGQLNQVRGEVGIRNPFMGTVTDVDGNAYGTVKIGDQVWTTENLKTTKLNDGTAIPWAKGSEWARLNTPGYCWYGNDPRNGAKFGALYNWFAVNSGKLAPPGWRVPSEGDWETLQASLIAHGHNWDGTTSGNKIAKALAARSGWNADSAPGVIGNELAKNNTSGFSAIPGGRREYRSLFEYVGVSATWWSATQQGSGTAPIRHLSYGVYVSLVKESTAKNAGLSVRILMDHQV